MYKGRWRVKVLLVDEHPTTRVGLETILEVQEDMQAAGATGNAEEALRLVGEEDPDVVVLDLALDGPGSGLELCREIKALSDPPGVVVHTAQNSEETVISCRISGVDSYVYKGEEPNKLLEAIRETSSGKRVWFLGGGEGGPSPDLPANGIYLTPKEKEIFALLIKRYTNAQISEELSISLQTTKNHVSSILKKFEVASRTDLV